MTLNYLWAFIPQDPELDYCQVKRPEIHTVLLCTAIYISFSIPQSCCLQSVALANAHILIVNKWPFLIPVNARILLLGTQQQQMVKNVVFNNKF